MTNRLVQLMAATASVALALSIPSLAQAQSKVASAQANRAVPSAGAPVNNPIPSPSSQIMLIRDALAAFNQANLTNNYSVMQALGSANFRTANSPERLSQLFAVYRTNKVNLAPILYLDPTLSRPAALENVRLKLAGSFPSKPMMVNFDLTFEPSEGQWKLFGISVTLSPEQAAAPKK